MLLLWMLLYFRHFSSVRWGADVIIMDVILFFFVISLQSDEELMLLLRMLLYFCHFSSVRWGADVIIIDVTLFFRHFSSIRWGVDVIIKDVILFSSFLFSQMRSWCYYYGCYFIFIISLQSDEELMLLLRMLFYFHHFSSVRWGADVIIKDVTLFLSFLFSQMRSWCYYYWCYFIFVISLQSDEELMLLLRMLLCFRHFSSVRWGADVIIKDVTLFSSFLFSQMRSWCYY